MRWIQTFATCIMCWKFAWNVTGVMVVDSRLNLEQHCGLLLAQFHHSSPTWIHSCHHTISILGIIPMTSRRLSTIAALPLAVGFFKISGFMAVMGKFPSDNYKHSTSCSRCWRKLNLIVFIRTKFTNNPRCQEFIFSRLDARTLSTVGNAKHVELQHYAREQIKTETLCESRRANQLDT